MRVKTAQRELWLGVISFFIMAALGVRVFQLQMMPTFNNRDLVGEVIAQRRQQLPLQMRRGRILDRNGAVLTGVRSTYAVGLFPRAAGEWDSRTLSSLFFLGEVNRLMQARQNPEAQWVITEGVSRERAEAIRAANLPGIVVGSTGNRYGPDSLARHLVGYANSQGGQLGLEKAFEEQLAGDRVPYAVADFDGRNRLLYGAIREVEATTGKEPYDLTTTIDGRIQAAVEAALDRTVQPVTGNELRGAVVVLDVKSGEPLALASRPNFSQMQLPDGDALLNRALTAYEPGSVFKPLVAAIALEEGKLSLEEEFDCPASYELGGVPFYNYDKKGFGRLPFHEALARSCNSTMVELGYKRLGAAKLLEAARRFGLGQATGIYPRSGEDPGSLPALTYGGDVAQFSFGQGGLMATPLQIARAYAAIAGDGMLPPVRLVTTVRKPDGEVLQRLQAEEPRRIISRETARELRAALQEVTDPEGVGTGKAAWVEGVGSAGKTGSADTEQNGKKITHAWFAGWVPAEAPRYVIVVFIEDGKSGGGYAAPLFRQVAEGILER